MSDSHTESPATPALRIKAIQQLLQEKGLLPRGAIDKIVDAFEHKLGPKIGAKVVARAWTNPDYRTQLLTDAIEAIGEFGSHDPHLAVVERTPTIVVENTPTVHNVVVCTLCSCYPWTVLGLPPNWYKTPPYRSRLVIEPRGVHERTPGCRATFADAWEPSPPALAPSSSPTAMPKASVANSSMYTASASKGWSCGAPTRVRRTRSTSISTRAM